MSDTSRGPGGSQEPPSRGEGASWTIGLVLIAVGLAFMAERSGYLTLSGNWWALFIYVASVASLLNTWRSYRSAGRFGSGQTASLIWGLVLAVVATILYFGLAWSVWWPAILIVVGVGMVIGYLLGDRPGS